jgi:hypothetical protein
MLAIAQREEEASRWFEPAAVPSDAENTFCTGGLDNLGQELPILRGIAAPPWSNQPHKLIPAGYDTAIPWEPFKSGPSRPNTWGVCDELDEENTVWPGLVPRNERFVAYGATLFLKTGRASSHVQQICNEQFATFDQEMRRFLIALAFAGPNGRAVAGGLRRPCNAILNPNVKSVFRGVDDPGFGVITVLNKYVEIRTDDGQASVRAVFTNDALRRLSYCRLGIYRYRNALYRGIVEPTIIDEFLLS